MTPFHIALGVGLSVLLAGWGAALADWLHLSTLMTIWFGGICCIVWQRLMCVIGTAIRVRGVARSGQWRKLLADA